MHADAASAKKLIAQLGELNLNPSNVAFVAISHPNGFLRTVVVIGVLEPREDPPKKIMGPGHAGRKCDGRIFGRDGRI